MSASLSLRQALAQLPDPRGRHGRRQPLSALLSLTVLALLTGCKTLEAIVPFGRDHGTPLAHALGFRRGKTPAKSTLSNLFRALDVAAFEAVLPRWIAQRVPAEQQVVLTGGGAWAFAFASRWLWGRHGVGGAVSS